MAVFEFVKRGAEEMRIARPSAPAASSPSPADRAVTVRPGPVALYAEILIEDDDALVVLRDGAAIGIIGPGRHVLHPSRQIFLGEVPLVDGRLPIDLAFVSLAPILRARFVAPLAGVDARVEGEILLRVVDPAIFVEQRLRAPSTPLERLGGVAATLSSARVVAGDVRLPVSAGGTLDLVRAAEAARVRGPAACPACGRQGEAGAFCEGCGALVSSQRRCGACRAELAVGARFCTACGEHAV
jgi:hypothetical protein